MAKLIGNIALIVLPALAAYLMRRYLVPANQPLPTIPPALVNKARELAELPAVRRARNAAARKLRKGAWRMQAFSERVAGK